MDRKIEYQIRDIKNRQYEIYQTIEITTIGFPVEETLKFENEDVWYDNIDQITREFEDQNMKEAWLDFKRRLTSFLDDGNLRIILDIMQLNDSFHSEKFKLQTDVISYKTRE